MRTLSDFEMGEVSGGVVPAVPAIIASCVLPGVAVYWATGNAGKAIVTCATTAVAAGWGLTGGVIQWINALVLGSIWTAASSRAATGGINKASSYAADKVDFETLVDGWSFGGESREEGSPAGEI